MSDVDHGSASSDDRDLDLLDQLAAASVPRKRGETEMSVLKYKLQHLGTKTASRGAGLHDASSEHTSLYAVPPPVARSFTRTYLSRATDKLQALLDKPRQKSSDAVNGEQFERAEGEFRAAALTRMQLHAREQSIYAGRRVGWREKLNHAQVQRGIEEQKGRDAAGGRRARHEPLGDVALNRANQSRRRRGRGGGGSSTDEEEQQQREERAGAEGGRTLGRSASAAAGVSAAAAAASAPSASATYMPPSSSDFFLASMESEASEAARRAEVLVNEHTVRIKDMLDAHVPSHLVQHQQHQSPHVHARQIHNGPAGAGTGAAAETTASSAAGSAAVPAAAGAAGATLATKGKRKGGCFGSVALSAVSAHRASAAASPASPEDAAAPGGDESKESPWPADASSPQQHQQQQASTTGASRTLKGSASAPSLNSSAAGAFKRAARSIASGSGVGGVGGDRASDSASRWSHANGLHPTNMHSSAASTLKMVPRLPVHTGLAAEDVSFTPSGPPPSLFVDTHTALEIACAQVRFPAFRARHKQVHYLLLSPDMNYLALTAFWWTFVHFFQSARAHPASPAMLERLLANMGAKYLQLVRYAKIHMALAPNQRLSSWYDQFEGRDVAAANNGGEGEGAGAGNMSGGGDAATAAAALADRNSAMLRQGGQLKHQQQQHLRLSSSSSTRSLSAGQKLLHSISEVRLPGSGTPGLTRRNSTTSASASAAGGNDDPRGGGGNGGAEAPFDPLSCVPVYPAELFSDAMEAALRPKTRSGTHHALERFLLLVPFVLSSAVQQLLLAFFPESAHFIGGGSGGGGGCGGSFRSRLDREFHKLFGGVDFSEITLRKQREKFMDDSVLAVAGEKKASTGLVSQAPVSSSSSTATGADNAGNGGGGDDDGPLDLDKPSFESLFAFNAVVNPLATRGGQKYHEALLNPHHSSVPGSAALAAQARRLGAAEAVRAREAQGGMALALAAAGAGDSPYGSTSRAAMDAAASAAAAVAGATPTPLTRHMRLGGVLHQDATGEGREDEWEAEDHAAGAHSPRSGGGGGGAAGMWDSPPRGGAPSAMGSPVLGGFSPFTPGSPLLGGSMGMGSAVPPMQRAQSTVITSSRAFTTSSEAAAAATAAAAAAAAASNQPGGGVFGGGGGGVGMVSTAHQMLMSSHAASLGALVSPFSPGSAGTAASRFGSPVLRGLSNSASVPALGSPGPDPAAQAAQAALEEKARRRAREKPEKGSLHSTGDWSRDERERRDFLRRMAERHAALEKDGAKERVRAELRASRLTEDKAAEQGTGGDSADAEAEAWRVLHAQQMELLESADAHQQQRGFSHHNAIIEEGHGSNAQPRGRGRGSSSGGDGAGAGSGSDPIGSAFESVMKRRMDDVAPTVHAHAHAHGHAHGHSSSTVSLASVLGTGAGSSPDHAHKRAPSRSSVTGAGGAANARTGSLGYSASTPALFYNQQQQQQLQQQQQGAGTRPSTGASYSSPDRDRDRPVSPVRSPSLSSSPLGGPRSSLHRHRPSSINVNVGGFHGGGGGGSSYRSRSLLHGTEPGTASSTGGGGFGGGDHVSNMRARLSAQSYSLAGSGAGGAPHEQGHDHDAAPALSPSESGFTASDLNLPLQSMLLREENMRHAGLLRPPIVRLNVNSLTTLASKALGGLKAPSPSWGRGVVLKHVNPLPREKLGEDLGDGYAFRAGPHHVCMDTVAFSSDGAAAQRQAGLLRQYRELHALQLEESNMRGAHAGANLEHGDAARHASARKGASASNTLRRKQAPQALLAPLPNGAMQDQQQQQQQQQQQSQQQQHQAPSVHFAVPAPSTLSPPPAAVPSVAPSTLVPAGAKRSGHKASNKMDVLLQDSKQVHWNGGADDPDIFLTPRTKSILAQVDALKHGQQQDQNQQQQQQNQRQQQQQQHEAQEGQQVLQD